MRLTETDRQSVPQTWSGNSERTIAEARTCDGGYKHVVMARVHYRASTASCVRTAIRGLVRSAARLSRVLAVSATTTKQLTVMERAAFASVHTTLLELSVNCVCQGSTETPSSDDQVAHTLLLLHSFHFWNYLTSSSSSSSSSSQ